MIDYKRASAEVLEAVRAIIKAEGPDIDQGETVDRATVKLLGWAWCESVRAEFQAFVDADPELKAQHAVALELMKEDNYADLDPICMMPGLKPMIAKVENQEAVCVDHCMAQVMPLSAIYVNKVRIVQSAAARVSKAMMAEAANGPQEWPITIASGETFNSIEEMEQCPIQAVKDMAKAMRDAEAARRGVRPPPTCWGYFGFDGPTNLNNLQLKYRETIMGAGLDNDLVAEIHRQYQNCLKEIGVAILNGPDATD